MHNVIIICTERERERERERGEKGGEAELAAAFDHCSLCQVYSVNTDFTQPVPYIYIYDLV